MKISVITPNRNGEAHLAKTLASVLRQREAGVDLEYIVVDGESTDGSRAVIERYRGGIDRLICEPDSGPAAAINKGLRAAHGEVLAWLNADDLYEPGALARVARVLEANPSRALAFGACRIVDEREREIRRGITRFKELFFPFSSRFVIRTINYISQPAMFFRRAAFEQAGPLREDWRAAWDYELVLRLWARGGAVRVPGPPLAMFRWHAGSISGRHFARQFEEEYRAARADAGPLAPSTLLHLGVRWGIVGCYSLMAWRRRRAARG